MRTWIIIGVITVVLIAGIKAWEVLRKRRKQRAKAEKLATQAASRAAKKAEFARLEILKAKETEEQLALAQTALTGDQAAWEALKTTQWFYHASDFIGIVEHYYWWRDNGTALLDEWRGAIADGNINTAIAVARKYQYVAQSSRRRGLDAREIIISLMGIAPAEVREQTLLALDVWMAAQCTEAVAGSAEAYKRLKLYRHEHRTKPGYASDDYPFVFPEAWNKAVTLHEPVPTYEDFDWHHRELQAGEPRMAAAKALTDRDATASLMMLAWYNWQTKAGATLKASFYIESELRAQLALLIEEQRVANAPPASSTVAQTESA